MKPILSDKDQSSMVIDGGHLVNLPPINDVIRMIQLKYEHLLRENAELRSTNEKLKAGVWKGEEAERLTEENDRLRKEILNGFPITDEEMARIREWMKGRHTCYTYKFVPTSVGVVGVVIDDITHEEFEFQSL